MDQEIGQQGPDLGLGDFDEPAVARTVFARRQRRLADPLLDLRLFRSAAFTAALTTNLVSFFAGFGALLFIAQYLQLVLGLSPLAAGLGLFTVLGPGGLALLVTGSVVFSLGLAPVDTLATDLAVGAVAPERAGASSALTETSAEFGGALGIAILGVIGTGIYRSRLSGARPPGIPPGTVAAARDTLGGALAAARRLPGQAGQALAGMARHAFTQGLHVSFAVSAAAVLGAAVLAALQLRHLRPAAEPHSVMPEGRESHVA